MPRVNKVHKEMVGSDKRVYRGKGAKKRLKLEYRITGYHRAVANDEDKTRPGKGLKCPGAM